MLGSRLVQREEIGQPRCVLVRDVRLKRQLPRLTRWRPYPPIRCSSCRVACQMLPALDWALTKSPLQQKAEYTVWRSVGRMQRPLSEAAHGRPASCRV